MMSIDYSFLWVIFGLSLVGWAVYFIFVRGHGKHHEKP